MTLSKSVCAGGVGLAAIRYECRGCVILLEAKDYQGLRLVSLAQRLPQSLKGAVEGALPGSRLPASATIRASSCLTSLCYFVTAAVADSTISFWNAGEAAASGAVQSSITKLLGSSGPALFLHSLYQVASYPQASPETTAESAGS